jgi:hypothetical protein
MPTYISKTCGNASSQLSRVCSPNIQGNMGQKQMVGTEWVIKMTPPQKKKQGILALEWSFEKSLVKKIV